MPFLHILILSIIEGLTEFLPISSTGHLILTSAILEIPPSEYLKAFEIIIQFGAILAVIVLYRARLKWNFEYYKKVFFAFLPAAVLGFLLKDYLTALLDSTVVVAWALIAGGVVLLFVDCNDNRVQWCCQKKEARQEQNHFLQRYQWSYAGKASSFFCRIRS